MSVEEIIFFRHICNAPTSMNTVLGLVSNWFQTATAQATFSRPTKVRGRGLEESRQNRGDKEDQDSADTVGQCGKRHQVHAVRR